MQYYRGLSSLELCSSLSVVKVIDSAINEVVLCGWFV